MFDTNLRPHFIQQIHQAAQKLDIDVKWHSDQWVCELNKDGRTEYIIGYTLPLNNAASTQIASDKTATSVMLLNKGVDVVPHALLRPSGRPISELLTTTLEMVSLPMVLKPQMESGGIDVFRATTIEELQAALKILSRRYRAIALSPYLQVEHEYRTIMLDGDVKLAFEKVRAAVMVPSVDRSLEWRHNLRLGAHPEILANSNTYDLLRLQASKAMKALGLRFAAVDSIKTAESSVIVLEVNSAVSLERFSSHSSDCANRASDIYMEALKKTFG